MKVAIVSSSTGHLYRGAEILALRLCKLLKGFVTEVRIYKGGGEQTGVEFPVPCVKYNSILLGGVNSALNVGLCFFIQQTTFATAFMVGSQYAKECDIIHSTESWTAEQIVRLRKLLRHKPKVALSFFGFTDYWLRKKNMFDIVLQSAPYYIDDARKHNIDVSNWFCIPPHVDTNLFQPSKKLREETREKLGIQPDAFVVLSVGSLRGKRMDYIATELSKSNTNIYFLMVGPRERFTDVFERTVKQILGERVKTVVNYPGELVPFYNAADLFVLANPIEIFGIAFIEAMACEVPVVGHSLNPVTKWLIGNGGVTTNLLQEGALAEVLKKLYRNDTALINYGKEGRRRVLEEFSTEVVRKKLLAAYESVLSD